MLPVGSRPPGENLPPGWRLQRFVSKPALGPFCKAASSAVGAGMFTGCAADVSKIARHARQKVSANSRIKDSPFLCRASETGRSPPGPVAVSVTGTPVALPGFSLNGATPFQTNCQSGRSSCQRGKTPTSVS